MVLPADLTVLELFITGSASVIVILLGSILAYLMRRLGRIENDMRAGFAEMRGEFITVRKDIATLAAYLAFIRGQLAPRPEQIRKAEG